MQKKKNKKEKQNEDKYLMPECLHNTFYFLFFSKHRHFPTCALPFVWLRSRWLSNQFVPSALYVQCAFALINLSLFLNSGRSASNYETQLSQIQQWHRGVDGLDNERQTKHNIFFLDNKPLLQEIRPTLNDIFKEVITAMLDDAVNRSKVSFFFCAGDEIFDQGKVKSAYQPCQSLHQPFI